MVRFFRTEAGAILIWLVAALLGAALLMPILCEQGRALAPILLTKGDVLRSVGESIERAGPGRFFSRALLLSGLTLLYPLILRIREIPKSQLSEKYKLCKLPWSKRLNQLGWGLLIGTGSLGLVVLVLFLSDGTINKEVEFNLGKILSKALIPALGAGVVEELVFRGLILGLWLRACSVQTAWIGSSLMFSVLHFLELPPGAVIENPEAWYAGLEVLGNVLGHFTNPLFFLTSFLTFALLGLLLAYCRTKTASLWMPIGIHAGLVLALKVFSLHYSINIESGLFPWLIGVDLTKGMLPLIALTIAFAASAFVVRRFSRVTR